MIKTYEEMKVEIIHSTTNSDNLLQAACDRTQKQELTNWPASKQLIKYLLQANHTSLFEHMSATINIEGVSRSFLAQITRHRMASYTVSSQHYQEYSEYDHILHSSMTNDSEIADLLYQTDRVYMKLQSAGIPKGEARQILTNSKAVNILWTINARSLINFLNLRLCKRNTKEMQIFAYKLKQRLFTWWPNLFRLVGPDCFMKGKCFQGPMKAKECKHEETKS